MVKQYTTTTGKITDIPFHYLLKSETSHLLEGVGKYAEWLIPQALEKINENLLLVRDVTGLINTKESLAKTGQALGSEGFQWFGGMIKYLTRESRKDIIGNLVQIRNPNISTLVPLVFSALKIHRKVNYSEWDLDNISIHHLIEKPLLDAMKCRKTFDIENLIQYREHSRVVQSGKTEGKVKELTHTVKILSTKDKEFDSIPSLAKIMYCQIWLAHPSIRTNLMVLNPLDLDSMPEPLSQEDFIPLKKEKEEMDNSVWII